MTGRPAKALATCWIASIVPPESWTPSLPSSDAAAPSFSTGKRKVSVRLADNLIESDGRQIAPGDPDPGVADRIPETRQQGWASPLF